MNTIKTHPSCKILLYFPEDSEVEVKEYVSIPKALKALEKFQRMRNLFVQRVEIFEGTSCIYDSEKIIERPRVTMKRIQIYAQESRFSDNPRYSF